MKQAHIALTAATSNSSHGNATAYLGLNNFADLLNNGITNNLIKSQQTTPPQSTPHLLTKEINNNLTNINRTNMEHSTITPNSNSSASLNNTLSNASINFNQLGHFNQLSEVNNYFIL